LSKSQIHITEPIEYFVIKAAKSKHAIGFLEQSKEVKINRSLAIDVKYIHAAL